MFESNIIMINNLIDCDSHNNYAHLVIKQLL